MDHVGSRWQKCVTMIVATGLWGSCSARYQAKYSPLSASRPLMISAAEKRVTDQEAVRISLYLNSTVSASRGDSAGALRSLEQLRSIDPENARVRFLLAKQYIDQMKIEQGVAELKVAMQQDPQDREIQLTMATLHQSARRFQDAESIYRNLLLQNPEDDEVMASWVALRVEGGDSRGAMLEAQTYLKRRPQSGLVHYALGEVYEGLKNSSAAIGSFRQAMKYGANPAQAGFRLAELLEQSGQRDEAVEMYRWLADRTDHSEVYRRLGQLSVDRKDYEQALWAFENYLRQNPNDLNHKAKVGVLCLEAKLYDRAAKLFEDVTQQSEKEKPGDPGVSNLYFYLGLAYENSQNLDAAVAAYAKVHPGQALSDETYRRHLQLLAKLKQLPAGRKVIKKFRPKEGNASPDYFVGAAQFFDKFAQSDEALKWIEQGLSVHPQQMDLLFQRALSLEKLGRIDEGIQSAQAILDQDPQSVSALNFIGYTLADHNRELDRAEKLILKAIGLRPKNPYILDSLGWVYFRKGQYHKAYPLLREAHELSPEESVIAEHLGDVLLKLGRVAEAKTYFELALRLGPEKARDKENIERKLSQLIQDLDRQPTGQTPAVPSR